MFQKVKGKRRGRVGSNTDEVYDEEGDAVVRRARGDMKKKSRVVDAVDNKNKEDVSLQVQYNRSAGAAEAKAEVIAGEVRVANFVFFFLVVCSNDGGEGRRRRGLQAMIRMMCWVVVVVVLEHLRKMGRRFILERRIAPLILRRVRNSSREQGCVLDPSRPRPTTVESLR